MCTMDTTSSTEKATLTSYYRAFLLFTAIEAVVPWGHIMGCGSWHLGNLLINCKPESALG